MIDEKLDRMLRSINTNISQHLKELNDWVGIVAVESATSEAWQHIVALNKSVNELKECLLDFHN